MNVPATERVRVETRLRAAGCVFAEDEAGLLIAAAGDVDELAALVGRRAAGLPLEQVVGWASFCGARVVVEPGVFVPRRRTEFLVRTAAALAPPRATVVDLCCGSGAVGVALARAVAPGALYGVDVDPVAVGCAGRNLAPVGGTALRGDLYGPLPSALRGRVDLLVANAPYVPTAEIDLLPAEARLHERPVALDGGGDGLDVVRRIVRAAPDWLAPGGHLVVETSVAQSSTAVAGFAAGGLEPAVHHDAELDATVVVGSR